MTDDEWDEFCGRLEATFDGGLPADREHELRRHVGMVPFEVAERAISRLVQGVECPQGAGFSVEPLVWMPKPGQLLAAVRRVTGGGWAYRVALSGKTSAELEAEVNGYPRLAAGTGDVRVVVGELRPGDES